MVLTSNVFSRTVVCAVAALVCWQLNAASAMTLEEAIRLSVSTHPTVQKAKANKRAVDQDVNEARASFLPTVDGAGEFGYEYTDNFFTRNRNGSGSTESLARKLASGEIRQNLFEGFGGMNRSGAAAERVNAAGHTLLDSAEAVGLNAAAAYIDVLRARHLVNLAEENVTAHVDVRNDIKYRVEKGRSDSGDFNQAESRVSLARERLNQARGQLRQAEATFLQAVGDSPGTLETPRPPYQAVPASVDLAVASAADSNPALRAAANDVRAREFEARAQKAPYYPKFDIKLTGQGGDDVDGVEGADNRAQALLVMNYNLYRGGADQARYRRAIERASEARQREAELRRRVEEQTRIEYASLLTARENLPISETRAKAAARVVSAYLQQFELGQRSLLDVLDVVNELFEANVGVVNTDAEMMQAYYRVLATMGSLLTALNVSTEGTTGRPPTAPGLAYRTVR